MDNKAVAAKLDELAESLMRVELYLSRLSSLAEGQARAVEPRAVGGWPTSPTLTQGFLNARWQRRDGDVYSAGGSTRANSPIRGGDDAGAQVDVPSGVHRAESTEHTPGDLRSSKRG